MWCCVSVMLLECNALPVKGSPTRSYAPKLSSRSCRSAGECLRSHKSLRRHHRWKDADSLINQFSYAQYLNRTTLLSTPFFWDQFWLQFWLRFLQLFFESSVSLELFSQVCSSLLEQFQATLASIPLSSSIEFSLWVLPSSSPILFVKFSFEFFRVLRLSVELPDRFTPQTNCIDYRFLNQEACKRLSVFSKLSKNLFVRHHESPHCSFAAEPPPERKSERVHHRNHHACQRNQQREWLIKRH